MAFYEPLHEDLGELSRSRLTETNTQSWESGHSPTAPYFVEFAPLVGAKRPGVAGFERSFAFDRFFVDADEPENGVVAYLRGLEAVAIARGRQPVFKFCRSLGRVGWMRRHFPDAAHIAIVRDPLAQWESSWHLAERGTPYFLAMPAALLARNAGHPLVDAVTEAFELRLAHLRAEDERCARKLAERFAMQATMAMTYRVALAFWLVTGLTSVPYAELSIDSDLLAASVNYRRGIEGRLDAATGLPVTFDSARTLQRDPHRPMGQRELSYLHGLARAIAGAYGSAPSLCDKL